MIRFLVTLGVSLILGFSLGVHALSSEPTIDEPTPKTNKTTQKSDKPRESALIKPDEKKDPNGCEAKGMWYRADNNECIPKTTTPKPTPTPTGDWVTRCHAYAKQAGLVLPPDAIKLIDKESDCNPYAQNPYSTAYGIGQFLDSTWASYGCVKNSDPSNQLLCMKKYVYARYGSWTGAWNFWLENSWY